MPSFSDVMFVYWLLSMLGYLASRWMALDHPSGSRMRMAWVKVARVFLLSSIAPLMVTTVSMFYDRAQ